ncbi:hypothetical protein [Brevirhabdus sp.]|uniref:hypothetical protein n=1 Tax=Brevirhabdus sp. TaxID=2004514 RepID=UPI0040581FCF
MHGLITRLAGALALAALPLLGLAPSPAAAQAWCGNGNLNPTERTICNDQILGDMDDALRQLYRDAGAGQAAAQRDWLVNRRNACGSDIFCIERAYQDRIAQLTDLRGAPRATPDRAPVPAPATRRFEGKPRPWCGGSRLNPTERTICADETLSDMDAALEAVYGRVKARDGDRGQLTWLRGDRDACGANVDCIAGAYLRRIVILGGRLRRE